jgi:hypothetical protein
MTGWIMKKRFRSKPDKAVGERLIKEARLAREKAEQFPPSMERGSLGTYDDD